MDQRKQREIARKGGQAAHQKGTAHEFTSDEARAAGRKGGEIVSANRAHMSAIGRKGGESSHSSHKGRDAAISDSKPERPIEESAEAGHHGQASNGKSANGGIANDESSVNDEAGHSNGQSRETNGNGHAERSTDSEIDVNSERE